MDRYPHLNSLKKEPKQPRAQQTVQRIIKATEELVTELGVDGITTNKVAERANVNIASLYQYFPNKQALLSAVLQTFLNDLTRALNDLTEQLGDISVEETTRLWASLGMQYFRDRGGIVVELMKNPYWLASLPEGREFELRLMEAMRRFLFKQRERLVVKDLDRSIYVAFNAAISIISKHLLEPVPFYKDEEIAEEVVRLLTLYFYGEVQGAK